MTFIPDKLGALSLCRRFLIVRRTLSLSGNCDLCMLALSTGQTLSLSTLCPNLLYEIVDLELRLG